MNFELTAFIIAVRHLASISKALVDTREEGKRNELYAEIGGAIVDVNSKHLAILQEYQTVLTTNEALKKQIAGYDKWEEEKTRYSLTSVGHGTTVYALDETKAFGEPPHWLCPNCYQERKKSILQYHGHPGSGGYKCSNCPLAIVAGRSIAFSGK